LSRTGDNLANYLQYIEREDPAGVQEMLERIAKKIPGIQAIKSLTTLDRRLLLEFKVEGFEHPFYAQDMSNGTLKTLAYLLLMEDPNPSQFIGIEEPENGLYSMFLGELVAEFETFSRRQNGPQILITTHSQNLVDALIPEEVWILHKGKDGFSRLRRTADIRGVPELYEAGLPMGSLWYSNHFGTDRP
jgi:predicted ATPase